MAKSIFLVGTSTNVGKTYISSLIVKSMILQGYNCGYFKPVLTGVEYTNGECLLGDVDIVKSVSGLDYPSHQLTSYYYDYPASPHLSSSLVSSTIDINKILVDYNNLCKSFDFIVVEGVGGVFCPFVINDSCVVSQIDLIKQLQIPTIIIGLVELGIINISYLTTYYLSSNNIKIKGFIFNKDDDGIIAKDSIQTMNQLTNIPTLFTVKNNDKDVSLNNIKELFI